MAKLTPIKVVEKYDLNACRCCGLADKHRLYLFGDKSKSEGILKAFKKVTGFTDCEDSVSFLCRSCYAKVSNIVKKICELKSVFEEWERKRKVDNESLRYKRGHKEGDSPKQDDLVNTASPVRHVVKKAMATTPPSTKINLFSRLQRIAPKPSTASQSEISSVLSDETLLSGETLPSGETLSSGEPPLSELPTETSTQPQQRVLPHYLLPAKPRTEGAEVLDNFGVHNAKVNL